MAALPRPRPLQGGIDIEAPTRLQKRRGVVLPVCFVEVGGKEVARLVQEQWIDASDERLAMFILAREVPANHVVGHRQKSAMLTLGALDPRLLSDAAHPFVRASRGIA